MSIYAASVDLKKGGEKGERERQEKTQERIVQITGEQEVFFPLSFRHCERKEKGKHKGRRRRVESRENKWKRLSFLKIIKSQNKQGLPFGLCSIPCNKICRKEENRS